LDIILLMSKPLEANLNKSSNKSDIFLEKQILQTECVVLLQMLCDFKPSLHEELGISRNIDDIVGSGTACIEIIWRGSIHRRFFHVPKVCEFLAKSSKDALVEFVDRTNAENKLTDFLNRSHDLYREVKHQQFLTEKNVSFVFSGTTQDRASWFTFSLALIVNLLLLFDYSAVNVKDGIPTLNLPVRKVLNVLNIIQSVAAFIVLILFIVVKIPVKYQTVCAAGYKGLYAFVYTAMEPLAIYYTLYFIITILAGLISFDFLPWLVLDIIVKNSTARDVLNAVLVPINQIAMGCVVIVCIIQIYAFFVV
jgi:hypothetical protein